MPAILEWTHTVVEDDLDGLGHANNISYLKWMQSAALAHSAAQGWPVEAYAALGCGWVVRSHFIEYLAPALLGDTILIRTWVADMGKVTSRRRFLILRGGDDSRRGASERHSHAERGNEIERAKRSSPRPRRTGRSSITAPAHPSASRLRSRGHSRSLRMMRPPYLPKAATGRNQSSLHRSS